MGTRTFKYICGWCDYEFFKEIPSHKDEKDDVKEFKAIRPRCPNCKELLKRNSYVE